MYNHKEVKKVTTKGRNPLTATLSSTPAQGALRTGSTPAQGQVQIKTKAHRLKQPSGIANNIKFPLYMSSNNLTEKQLGL